MIREGQAAYQFCNFRNMVNNRICDLKRRLLTLHKTPRKTSNFYILYHYPTLQAIHRSIFYCKRNATGKARGVFHIRTYSVRKMYQKGLKITCVFACERRSKVGMYVFTGECIQKDTGWLFVKNQHFKIWR